MHIASTYARKLFDVIKNSENGDNIYWKQVYNKNISKEHMRTYATSNSNTWAITISGKIIEVWLQNSVKTKGN